MKRNIVFSLIVLVLAMTLMVSVKPQHAIAAEATQDNNSRHVPARIIPVPSTVSPELRSVIARPLRSMSGPIPATLEAWRNLVANENQQNMNKLEQLRKLYPTNIRSVNEGGVKTFMVTPESVPEENANRILIHLRGGGYVFNGGEGGIGEAILMAFHGKIKVASVDYRMAPDFPYPAALDDAVSVYKETLKTYKPANVGIFGTSAGGGLTAATVLNLRDLNIPLPGAVGLGTPWADLTKTGDTCYTNEYIDDVLIEHGAFLDACGRLYAGAHDMKNPFISPVYGDFSKGFPPTILTSGTRDLFLSDTVRMRQKLRQSGVIAELQVFEAMSHAQYIKVFTAPESQEAFQEMARFFGNHLGR